MAKKKQEGHAAELQKDFNRRDRLYKYGGSDTFWSDGCNMNLVRNHILNNKRKIEETMTLDEYPAIYFRETPPEMDRDYMARADEIRKNAKESLEAYLADPDYQYLCRWITRLTDKQKKDTSIVQRDWIRGELENSNKY